MKTFKENVQELSANIVNTLQTLLHKEKFRDEYVGNCIPFNKVLKRNYTDYDCFSIDWRGSVILCRNGYGYDLSCIEFYDLCEITDEIVEYYKKHKL